MALLRQAAFGEAEGEAVDGAQDALVVGGRGGSGGPAAARRMTAAAATHSSRGSVMWQSM